MKIAPIDRNYSILYIYIYIYIYLFFAGEGLPRKNSGACYAFCFVIGMDILNQGNSIKCPKKSAA